MGTFPFGLTSLSSESQTVGFQFNTAQTNQLSWAVMGSDGLPVTNGSIDNPIVGVNTARIPLNPGSYTLIAHQAGAETNTQDFTVGNSPVTVATDMIGSDTGTSLSPPATPIPAQTLTVLSNAIPPPTPEEEFIYPDTAYNKYYTATQARIYVGNLFIDEIDTLQFVLQDNTVPIFGYSSRYLDAYGQGRSLVQGQLALNFVTEGYLYTVLQNVTDMALPETTQANTSQQSQLDGYLASRSYLSAQPQTAANTAMLNYVNQQIQQLIANIGPPGVQYMRSYIESRTQAPDGYKINPVYQPVLFDLEMDLGEGPTLRIRRLEKIKLVSNEMIVDQSGKHLLDCYAFLARRLR